MDGSFIDENGVERHAPAFYAAYEDRPAPRIRLVLGVLCVLFVWAGFQSRDRAGAPPEESWENFWLEHSGEWSRRFEHRVLPTFEAVVSGTTALNSDVVNDLLLGSGPYVELPPMVLPDGAYGVGVPVGQVHDNFDLWRLFASPRDVPTQQLGKSWDLAVLELVGNDPTTIDLEGLAALDPREFLTRLRAQEAVAREAMQRDYDSAQFAHRVYTVAQWAFFVLAIGCIPAAVWVRQATLRAVRRDNERLRHEWRAYAVARRAAAAREAATNVEQHAVG